MLSKPFNSRCSTTYHASKVSGTRPTSAIKLIVLHDTEGGTARNIARYFEGTRAHGSAHLVVDDVECFRTLDNREIPWAAPGANTQGFHIEQCGYARWSLVLWGKHRNTLKRAAYKTAFHCVKFGIPPVFLTAPDLRVGGMGITTHAECTKAFGGDHTDPGPLWPRRLFMRYVREFYTELTGIQF